MNAWSQANSSSRENVFLSPYTQFQSDYSGFLGKRIPGGAQRTGSLRFGRPGQQLPLSIPSFTTNNKNNNDLPGGTWDILMNLILKNSSEVGISALT